MIRTIFPNKEFEIDILQLSGGFSIEWDGTHGCGHVDFWLYNGKVEYYGQGLGKAEIMKVFEYMLDNAERKD